MYLTGRLTKNVVSVLKQLVMIGEKNQKQVDFSEGVIQHFGEYTYLLSCRELDEKTIPFSYQCVEYEATARW